MLKKILLASGALAMLCGCAAVELTPAAQQVKVSPKEPAKECQYIAHITGGQGNFFTGSFTSNKALEEGALNDMRNQAAAKGGNYVEILNNRAGITGGNDGSSQQTNVVYTGNVYNCPNK